MDSQTLYVYANCQEVNQQAMGLKDPALLRLVLNGYQEIMTKGSGMCLPHAMNSYVYLMQNYGGLILGLSDEERSDFHDYGAKILTYVTTIPVDLQDANAYSNLALLETGRKRYKEALDAVNAGIAILKEDRLHYPDSAVGNSRPLENPGIKLELFSTKAELIYRSGQKDKAKELAQIILEEANSLQYSGPDIEKVKWILAQP
jgi:tetratricopeptide (TPR) repeat protein